MLGRWLEELRKFYKPDFSDDEHSREIEWVTLEHHDPSGSYDGAIEALCLLNQLARVDVDAFRREVVLIWDSPWLQRWAESDRYKRNIMLKPTRLPLRFGIRVMEFRVDTRLPSTQQLPPSAEFTDLWQELAARPTDSQCIDTAVGMTIPVCIDIATNGRCSDELERFVTLVQEQQQATPPPVDTPHLRIDALFLLSGIGISLDGRGLEVLTEVAASGINVLELPEISVYDTAKTSLQVADGLRTLLRLPTFSSPSSRASEVIGGYICKDSKHLLPAYMTAVQESESMRSIQVNLDIDPDDLALGMQADQLSWYFKLLAYTLFSEHANHQINFLEFNLEHFDDDALSVMVQTLRHPDPLALLFSVDEETRDAFPKQIAACQFYLYEQGLTDLERAHAGFGRVQEQTMYESPDPIIVRVIEGPAEDEWWRVLLPGWGCAWVHEDDMIPTGTEDHFPVRASRPSIRSITVMTMSNESMAHVVDLLATIAGGTEHLCVSDRSDFEPDDLDDWCGEVVRSCPQLKSLTLSVAAVRGLNAFVHAAVHSNAKLETLSLGQVMPEEAEDVRSFFNALCNPTHPLTRHLRVLSLGFVIEASEAEFVIDPLVQMLKINRSLVSIDVLFRDPYTGNKVTADTVSAAFADLLREAVVVRVAPLEIEKKLALLSAVQGHATPACVQRLDSLTLTSIFEFAAHGQTRQVVVSLDNFSNRSTAD